MHAVINGLQYLRAGYKGFMNANIQENVGPKLSNTCFFTFLDIPKSFGTCVNF